MSSFKKGKNPIKSLNRISITIVKTIKNEHVQIKQNINILLKRIKVKINQKHFQKSFTNQNNSIKKKRTFS